MARVHAPDASTLEWVANTQIVPAYEIREGDEILGPDGYVTATEDGAGFHSHAPVRRSKGPA